MILFLIVVGVGENGHAEVFFSNLDDANGLSVDKPGVRRARSRSFMGSDDDGVEPIEYILASDASAIIEHTKKVMYLEDDDVAHIADGGTLM